MNEIVLINPRRRRRRKMSAKQRKYFGRRRARKSVARVSRRRRRNPIGAYMAGNPRRRRRHRSVARYVGRRRHRNPRFSLGGLKGITSKLIPAGIGGLGAVALDVTLASLPVPDMLKTGPIAIATKIAGALGLGWVAGMLIGRENGKLVTMGALTVVAYNVIRGVAQQVLPATTPGLSDYTDYGMGGLGWVSPAPVLGAYQPNGLGAYQPPASSDATLGGYDYNAGM